LGTYTVIETVPPSGWQIDPDSDRLITVTATELNPVIGTQGSDDTGTSNESDFHNFQLGSIHGLKFEDLDANGLLNGSEAGMGNITIRLRGDIDGNGTIDTLDTTTTAAGKFQFLNLHPGVYTVTELFSGGTEWAATVDHNGDGTGDNTST